MGITCLNIDVSLNLSYILFLILHFLQKLKKNLKNNSTYHKKEFAKSIYNLKE